MVGRALIVWLFLSLSLPLAASQSVLAVLIPEYPRSQLVETTVNPEPHSHQVILGSIENKAGRTVPERAQEILGRRFASTWYLPDERRTGPVRDWYFDRLSAEGEVLFSCSGFACGSSNHWANQVFGNATLFGPPEHQHYFLTRIERESTYYVSTYVAMRGTGKVYAHVDSIVVEAGAGLPDGPGVVARLLEAGRVVIEPGSEDQMAIAVAEALRLRPLLRIAVVGHNGRLRGETVAEAVERSRRNAERFTAALQAGGIKQTRLSTWGVGPLVPLERDIVDRVEVVLVEADQGLRP